MLKNKEEQDEIEMIIDESIRIRKCQPLRHRRRLSIYEQSRIINPGQKRKQKTLRYRKAKQKNTFNTTQANTRPTCNSPSNCSYSNVMLSLTNNNNSTIKYGSRGHNDGDEGNDEDKEIIILPPKKRLMLNNVLIVSSCTCS